MEYIMDCYITVDDEKVDFCIKCDEEATSEINAKLAVRALKKILDAHILTGEIEGYNITMYKGNMTQSIVSEKTLYHKEKKED